jgi:hypothetical protein
MAESITKCDEPTRIECITRLEMEYDLKRDIEKIKANKTDFDKEMDQQRHDQKLELKQKDHDNSMEKWSKKYSPLIKDLIKLVVALYSIAMGLASVVPAVGNLFAT